MAIDLSKYNRKELLKIQSDVEKAIRKLNKSEMKEAKKAAERAAAEFGFSLAEITSNSSKGATNSVSAPKFANPEDPTQTWSGRGRQPQWYKKAISDGKTPEELEI